MNLIAVVLTGLFFRVSTGQECPECCRLVYRTQVRDWPESSRKVWAASMEWYLDDQEVETVLGKVDRFEVRHGKLKCWGGRIDEGDAQYITLPGTNASATFHQLPLGYYGVQICAFGHQHPRHVSIDWTTAWVGTIDVGNPNGHARHTVRGADITHSTCHSGSQRREVAVLVLILLCMYVLRLPCQ